MARPGREKKKKVKRKIIVDEIIKILVIINCDLTEIEEEKHFYSNSYHFNQTDGISLDI